MIRNKKEETKFTLVTWQDSDIPELIVDCSYAGKLMPKPANEGNKKTQKLQKRFYMLTLKLNFKKKTQPMLQLLLSKRNVPLRNQS